MGRSSDSRVRPEPLTLVHINEYERAWVWLLRAGTLRWLLHWQERCHLDQKVTALIWKLMKATSVSATFEPLIPKLSTFRHKFKKHLSIFYILFSVCYFFVFLLIVKLSSPILVDLVKAITSPVPPSKNHIDSLCKPLLLLWIFSCYWSSL